MNNRTLIIGLLILAMVGLLGWLFVASSKPLPGQRVEDLGREHVTIGTEVEYNSNPPTSGNHYSDWVRAGVYSEPKDDRNLVHSLEHGYVIMHYRCLDKSETAQMTEESGVSTEQSLATSSASKLPEDCKTRQDQLAQVYEKKGKRKLIVVPRENLDTNFALTAWTYIDKFDDFDYSRIEKFIDAHRDQGPEKTME